jgi:hypothetical protein
MQTELEGKILRQEEILKHQEIGTVQARSLEEFAENEALKLGLQAELSGLRQAYDTVSVSRQYVHKACPALDALDVSQISDKTSNAEIFESMKKGFAEAHAGIDQSIAAIEKGDVPLEVLTPVIEEVRKDPCFAKIQSDIDQRVSNYNSQQIASQCYWAGVETGAPMVGAFFGYPGLVVGGAVGTTVGVVTSYQDLKRANIISALSKADEFGHGVLDPKERQEADFNRYMAYGGLALTALDVGVVGAARDIAKRFPKTFNLSVDGLALSSNFPKIKISGDTQKYMDTLQVICEELNPHGLSDIDFAKIAEDVFRVPNYSKIEGLLNSA